MLLAVTNRRMHGWKISQISSTNLQLRSSRSCLRKLKRRKKNWMQILLLKLFQSTWESYKQDGQRHGLSLLLKLSVVNVFQCLSIVHVYISVHVIINSSLRIRNVTVVQLSS